MTEYEQDAFVADATDEAGDESVARCERARGPRWWRIVKRVLIGIGVTIVLLIVTGVLLYSFGGMERPSREIRAQYGQLVSSGQVAPVQGRFVIPIPGCRCHSDDPVQTVQHASYRISECTQCH